MPSVMRRTHSAWAGVLRPAASNKTQKPILELMIRAWLFFAGEVKKSVQSLAAADGITNPKLTCGTLNVNGFPFRFDVTCAGATLVSANSGESTEKGKKRTGGNLAAAKEVGKAVAERAKAKGIKKVVFDRGGYIYHGRVKALADAAREGGLEF